MKRIVMASVVLVACGSGTGPGGGADAAAPPDAGSEADAAMPDSGSGQPPLPTGGVGACDYTNPFSSLPECKQYTGSGWTEVSAADDCADVFAGEAGTFTAGGSCSLDGTAGACVVAYEEPEEYVSVHNATPELCNTIVNACENFARGQFVPTAGGPCEDGGGGDGGLGPDGGELQPEALAAMESSAAVTVSPECVDDTCVSDLASARQFVAFTPTAAAPTSGVILYPGGNVDPRGYAVAAHEIARRGYLVVLVPMPDNLAVNGVDRAGDVIADHPSIDTWVLLGHSLGGVAAIKYVMDRPGDIDGLALWATFVDSSDDISDRTIKTVSVYGDLDPLAPVDDVLASAAKLPPETIFARIRGGNHSHFLWHGLKEGDVESELISQEDQSNLAIGATLHLLRRIEAGEPDAVLPVYAEAAAHEAASGCGRMQQTIGNFSNDALPLSSIEVVVRDAFRAFWSAAESFAHVTPGEEPLVHVYQYTRQLPNDSDVHAPPIIDGELFCKLMTTEGLIAGAGAGAPIPSGEQNPCYAHTAAAYAWAFEQLSPAMREAIGDWDIVYDDRVYPSGPEFMTEPDSYVHVRPGDEPNEILVTTPTFLTTLDEEEWGTAAGRTYCKALSYQNALWRLYARAQYGAEPWTD